MTGKSELMVITAAKKLNSYVMTITQKSPKQFRFSLVSRLQGYSLDCVENLYRANEIFIADARDTRSRDLRLHFQQEGMTSLKLLGWIAQVSLEQGCIQMKQYEQISQHALDCQNLLGAWMNSDRRRFSSGQKE